jgi:hypothetical protein
MLSNFDKIDKVVQEIDLEDCDSEDEKKQIEKAFLEGECSELGIKLNYLVNKWLPHYFEKELIVHHVQAFSTQLRTEASCLSGWRILFQQLSITTLFLHSLITDPLPKYFKNTDEFNQVQKIAKQIIILGAEVQYADDGDHNIHFLNGDVNFYELQVITRFIDSSKLAKTLLDTLGPEFKMEIVNPPTNVKALNLFITKVCSAMRMVRYALELIDKQILLVDTATLQDHLPIVKQAFYFYQEAILETSFPHFLKIDLHDVQKNAFIDTTDRETFSDNAAMAYFKELIICQLFAFESCKIMLADYAEKCEMPDISESYRRELKLIIDNEQAIKQLVSKISAGDTSEIHTQILSIHQYFDYAMFYVETQRVKALEEKEALPAVAKIFWGIKYNIDCLIFIINCLRTNSEIYQHAQFDAAYKLHAEPVKKPRPAPKPKVEVEEKKLITISRKEEFENLQMQITLLREKRQAFYDIYNLTVEHKAVKTRPQRKTKLVAFKNTLINIVMVGVDDISKNLEALKPKRDSEVVLSEFSSYVNKIEELTKQADNVIKELTAACKNWNINTSSTPVPEPLMRRHSENSASLQKKERKFRAVTPRSAKPIIPIATPDTLTPLNSPLAATTPSESPVENSSSTLAVEKPFVTIRLRVDTLGEITTQIFSHLAIVVDAAVEEKISIPPLEEILVPGRKWKNSASQELEALQELQELQGIEYKPSLNDKQAAKTTYPAIGFFAHNVAALAFDFFDISKEWRSGGNFKNSL